MTELFNRRERAFFYAAAYLGFLFMSLVILWWVMLIGGNPLHFKGVEIVDQDGQQISALHVGQAAGIRRSVCSTKQVGVEFFPALRDRSGLLFPLPSGMVEAKEGCTTRTYGFVVPDVPDGEYEYASAIRYQTSLVGRSEVMVSPSIYVRITR